MDSDAKQWVRRNADGFLRRNGLKEKQTVLDFGCNTGNYARAAARVVGPAGKVYAVDKDRTALGKLKRRVKRSALGNIQCLHVPEGGDIPLRTRSVDVLLLYDVFHGGYFPERKNRTRLLRGLHRVLRRAGRLFLYPTHLKRYGLTYEQILDEVSAAGFQLMDEHRRQLVHDGRLVRGRVFRFVKRPVRHDSSR